MGEGRETDGGNDDITNKNTILNFLINYKINRYKYDLFIEERKQKNNTQVSISFQRCYLISEDQLICNHNFQI
jgi:hypothetical protein